MSLLQEKQNCIQDWLSASSLTPPTSQGCQRQGWSSVQFQSMELTCLQHLKYHKCLLWWYIINHFSKLFPLPVCFHWNLPASEAPLAACMSVQLLVSKTLHTSAPGNGEGFSLFLSVTSRHSLPALVNAFSDTQAFSSDPIYWPSFQPSCSGKILTPALQSSSLPLSSDIIGDFSIHLCEPQTTWLLSFSPSTPNDHFLCNTTDSHSHSSSTDMSLPEAAQPPKNVNSNITLLNYYNQSSPAPFLFFF